MLRRHRRPLRAVAEALLRHETLGRAELDAVLEESRQAAPLRAWAMGWARPALAAPPPSAAAAAGAVAPPGKEEQEVSDAVESPVSSVEIIC